MENSEDLTRLPKSRLLLLGNGARVSDGDKGSRTTSAAFTLGARVLDRDKASRITFPAFFHSGRFPHKMLLHGRCAPHHSKDATFRCQPCLGPEVNHRAGTQQTKRIFGPKTLQLFTVVQKAVAQACLWQIRLRTSAADEQLNSGVTLFSQMWVHDLAAPPGLPRVVNTHRGIENSVHLHILRGLFLGPKTQPKTVPFKLGLHSAGLSCLVC